MLSRIARASFSFNKPSLIYRCVATSSSNSGAASAAGGEVRRYPHDAPERDFVNFPPLRIPEHPGKLRMGLVPDEWCQAMYDKTGVTGPYLLVWGALATALSKEYLIIWTDTSEWLVFFAIVFGFSRIYGPKVAAYLDKGVDEANAAIIADQQAASKEIDAKILKNEQLNTLPEANQLIAAAKRENVQLQLEAAYRQRLQQVHQELRKRLDYQVAVQSVYKRVEKEQAINYIINEVRKSIGPAQEKEAFQSGLGQLKALSQKYAGTI